MCKVYEVQFDEDTIEVKMEVSLYLYFMAFFVCFCITVFYEGTMDVMGQVFVFVFVSLYLYDCIWWRHDGGNGAGITCFLEPRRVAATDQTWRHLVQVDKCTAQTSAECECAQASVQIQMYKYKYKYRPEAI